MGNHRARLSLFGMVRRYRAYLLLIVLLVLTGLLIWTQRDAFRTDRALYREARAAPPSRAGPLYAQLARRLPTIEEYARLWFAQGNLPSMDAVAALDDVIRHRPDSPAAYLAHLALARYYARLESPDTVDAYEAALSLEDTAEVRLELARYLEEQNATAGAYRQYQALLGRERPDAFEGMRRTAASPQAVAEDLYGSGFCSDVIDVLRDDESCEARCLRARALRCLGESDAADAEGVRCADCTADTLPAESTTGEDTAPRRDSQPPEPNPLDLWRSTWDMDERGEITATIPIYMRIAESDVYVSDDAAYRALILARRVGDEESQQRALELLESMQPNWLAWRATGELGVAYAPPYPESAVSGLVADLMAKVEALESLGREDLAELELRFLARVSETPEVVLAMAQELDERGRFLAAYSLAVPYLAYHPYAPEAYWRLAYPRPYAESVTRWASAYGVEAEVIWAIMRQESAFAPDIVSSAGAQGLMQLMPENVKDFSATLGPGEVLGDPFDPSENIRMGASHLAEVLSYFDGDQELALMAYNAGAGNVIGWLAEPYAQDRDDLLRFVPYGETREYVQRVSLNYLIYRKLYAKPTESVPQTVDR